MSYEKTYLAQTQSGQAAAMNATYATNSTSPPQPTRLSNCAGQLEARLAQLAVLHDRLSRVADRLGGSVPEEAQTGGGKLRGGGGGIAAQLEYAIEEFDALSRRAERTVERLEQL